MRRSVWTFLLLAPVVTGCYTYRQELPSGATETEQPAAPAGAPAPAPTSAPVVVIPVPVPSPVATPAPTPTPQPAPTATPAPQGGAPSGIDWIRVGFFGINCGKGNPTPRNGEKLLPVGCRGYVTATPKYNNGDDVPARVHGPDIEWFVLTGDDKIDVQGPTFASDFNKDLVGLRPGSFGLCATVKDKTGCLMGSVIP